ncbi:prepilin-type N-terminal cleavage/methylation domain-containing protein [Synechococcus moorigangaii CMS01]|nr:prepilin-type N-terminal cleavage/methylation domain-containing protein [Synechococcus moorigangaii CMS01]
MFAFRELGPGLRGASRSERGLTLLEILIVLLIAGILTAIATPSFIGFINRAKVNQDLAELQGLLQLAQREAIKKSQTCTVTLAEQDLDNPSLTATCLSTNARILDNVKLKYNNSGRDINFDFRGHSNPLRTIVLYSDFTDHRRCLVISNGIGMIRVGVYQGESLSNIVSSSCQTTS